MSYTETLARVEARLAAIEDRLDAIHTEVRTAPDSEEPSGWDPTEVFLETPQEGDSPWQAWTHGQVRLRLAEGNDVDAVREHFSNRPGSRERRFDTTTPDGTSAWTGSVRQIVLQGNVRTIELRSASRGWSAPLDVPESARTDAAP